LKNKNKNQILASLVTGGKYKLYVTRNVKGSYWFPVVMYDLNQTNVL